MIGGVMSLADLLGGGGSDPQEMMRQSEERTRPRILPEAQVARLREVFLTYSAPCPLRPGDFVIPRADSGMKHAGLPHVVLEVLEDPERLWSVDSDDWSGPHFGGRPNVRVAALYGETVNAYLCESWRFEPYVAAADDRPEPLGALDAAGD